MRRKCRQTVICVENDPHFFQVDKNNCLWPHFVVIAVTEAFKCLLYAFF